MKKRIGLVIAVIGILLMLVHIVYTSQYQSSKFIYLLVIGMLMNAVGVMYHIYQNRQQK